MTEKEKMRQGLPFDATNSVLTKELIESQIMLAKYNSLSPDLIEQRTSILKQFFGSTGKSVFVVQPMYCDYGKYISVGENFFANYNFTVLDGGDVTIGDNAFIGPNVNIYTACHPVNPIERNRKIEWTKPVVIGNNVWIGGNVTICPGVTIGDNVTIGAGSVVVNSIPANCVAVGNPCKPKKILSSELSTARMTLIPLTPDQLKLLLEDIPTLENQLHGYYLATPIEGAFREIILGQLKICESTPEEYLWNTFWLIRRNNDDAIIGSLCFHGKPNDNHEVEIGYGIGNKFEGQGYMSEATDVFCEWALSQTGVSSIIAETDNDNIASHKILLKCGFIQVIQGENTSWWNKSNY